MGGLVNILHLYPAFALAGALAEANSNSIQKVEKTVSSSSSLVLYLI